MSKKSKEKKELKLKAKQEKKDLKEQTKQEKMKKKMSKCEECEQEVKTSTLEEIDGKHLCVDCTRFAKMNPDDRLFYENVEPKLSKEFDYESHGLENVNFIKYSEEFFNDKHGNRLKKENITDCVFYRHQIPIKRLYQANVEEKFFRFNVVEELPILLFRYSAFGFAQTWMLVTNKKLYYSLETPEQNIGSMNLANINTIQIKLSSYLLAGVKGLDAKFTINEQFIGKLNLDKKREARLIHDYLAGLSLRKHELISSTPEESDKDPGLGISAKLKEIKDLFDNDIISEEDFNSKKKDLLEKIVILTLSSFSLTFVLFLLG